MMASNSPGLTVDLPSWLLGIMGLYIEELLHEGAVVRGL
jgi:hypothetical protein